MYLIEYVTVFGVAVVTIPLSSAAEAVVPFFVLLMRTLSLWSEVPETSSHNWQCR